MSKTTITLYDYLQSEFIKKGLSEFYEYGKLNSREDGYGMKFDDEANTLMYKILNYDKDTQDIMNERIFRGMKLSSSTEDIKYKKMFLMLYMNRQIGFQTIEEFASRVIFMFMGHVEYLDYYFSNLDNLLIQKSSGTTSGRSKNTGKTNSKGNNTSNGNSRSANVTLPQNEPFVDLDSTLVSYADDTRADFNKGTTSSIDEATSETNNEDSGNTSSESYTLDELLKIRNMMMEMIKEYEKPCFLWVW